MTDDLAARAQEAIERAAQHLYERHTGQTWSPHAITAAAWRLDAQKALAAIGLITYQEAV